MKQAIHAHASEQDIPQYQFKALSLSSAQWNKGQGYDPVISRVKDIVVSDQKPFPMQLMKETANERRYQRLEQIDIEAGVLYKKLETEGQETHQLVVPSSVKDIVLTAMLIKDRTER